jgi:hypothetical protein
MKVNKAKDTISTSGDFKEMEFGIREQDMGTILEILRDKMYSNKVDSICREVASNCRDANREAGNPNIPIEIGMKKSEFDKDQTCIYFKDNGPGINPERMADVFINYGSSTKRDSNKQTGGFGLGAKTPFSYADSFIIETIVGGTKYVYTAVVEERTKGKMYEVARETSNEPNGTTIVIPVEDKDYDNFQESVIKYTQFWEPRPTLVNFNREYEKLETKTDADGNVFFETYSKYDRGWNLCIDGIPYPVSSDMNLPGWDNITALIKFNTGDLTISATRENVQYDDRTVAKINNKILDVVKKHRTILQGELNKCTTYKEAVDLWQESWRTGVTGKDDYIHNDVTVSNYMSSVSGVQLNKVYASHHEGYTREGIQYISKTPQTIYLIDTHALQANRTRTILLEDSTFAAIEASPAIKKAFKEWPTRTLKEKKNVVQHLKRVKMYVKDLEKKGFIIKLYSEVLPTAAPRVTNTGLEIPEGVKIVSYKRVYRDRNSRRGSFLNLMTEKIQIENDVFVPPKEEEGITKVYYTIPLLSYDESYLRHDVFSEMQNAEFIRKYASTTTHEYSAIFTNKRNSKYFANLKTIDELIPTLDFTDLKRIYTITQAHNPEDRNIINYPIKHKFKVAFRFLNMVWNKRMKLDSNYRHITIPEKFKKLIQLEVSDAYTRASKTMDELQTYYPMVRFISRWEIEENPKVITEYIELMNKAKETV